MNRYKLINITTKEEIICDKVTIDGFSYYVSDEIIKDVRPHKGKWHIEKDYILNKFPTYLTDLSECKLVIATKNLNIDVPKVVDEFDLAFNYYNSNEQYKVSDSFHYMNGFNKTKETYQFTEQDMIEFAKWYQVETKTNMTLTTKELLDIWKSQQPITIYYE
jgi:hypothetical protein